MTHDSSQEMNDHFDLLPFVAILLCVLGCLLFITLSIAGLSLTRPKTGVYVAGQDKKPILVEWGQNNTTIQKNGKRIAIIWTAAQWNKLKHADMISLDELRLPKVLQETINDVSAQSSTQYIFFTVRPSGFETFAQIYRKCKEKHNIDIGYYPIAENENVEISRYSAKAKP